jgi:4-hydroxy-tetrahydrodipicolinate synthase
MFHGLYVALVTPFHRDGSLNEDKLCELVEYHVRNGTDGLVPCGTTGENPSYFSWEEHFRIVETVVRAARSRLKVVAGAGTNSTTRSLENVRRVQEIGADGALVITPYYNKPSQIGLYNHFRTLAEGCSIPLMLYNVPGRTSVDLQPETTARLAELKNVVALKEATGSVERASTIIRLCGSEIDILSGDDANTLPILAIGGRGVVSVAGNIIPADVKGMITAFEDNDLETARRRHLDMLSLCQAMFLDTNPVPVKAAMNILGMDVGDVRQPLAPMTPDSMSRLKRAMTDYGLIEE